MTKTTARQISQRDKRTLRMALGLACDWEQSFADANRAPAVHGKPDVQMRRAVRRCTRNIEKFKKLSESLR